MANGKVIIWTRPLVEHISDQKLFQANSDQVSWLPCIETHALALEFQPKFRDLSIIVSSPNAIRHLPPSLQAELKIAKKIYTFSRRASRILQDLQCRNVELFEESGNAQQFTAVLLQKIQDTSPKLLWLRGRDFAFDIAESLKHAGLSANELVTYETLSEVKNLRGKIYKHWRDLQPDLPLSAKHWCVAFASPSAVKAFESLFVNEAKPEDLSLEAICLGSTTAAALQKKLWQNVETLAAAKIADLAEACLRKL